MGMIIFSGLGLVIMITIITGRSTAWACAEIGRQRQRMEALRQRMHAHIRSRGKLPPPWECFPPPALFPDMDKFVPPLLGLIAVGGGLVIWHTEKLAAIVPACLVLLGATGIWAVSAFFRALGVRRETRARRELLDALRTAAHRRKEYEAQAG